MAFLNLFGGGGRGRRGAPPVYSYKLDLAGKSYDVRILGAETVTEAQAGLAYVGHVFRAALTRPEPVSPLALPAPASTPATGPVLPPPSGRPKARALAVVPAPLAATNFDRYLREMGRTGLLTVSDLTDTYRKWCREAGTQALAWPVLAPELSKLWGPSVRRRVGPERNSFYNVPALAVVPKRRAA